MRLSHIKRIQTNIANGGQAVPFYNPSSISIIEQKAKEFSSKHERKIISDVFYRLRKKLFGGQNE